MLATTTCDPEGTSRAMKLVREPWSKNTNMNPPKKLFKGEWDAPCVLPCSMFSVFSQYMLIFHFRMFHFVVFLFCFGFMIFSTVRQRDCGEGATFTFVSVLAMF